MRNPLYIVTILVLLLSNSPGQLRAQTDGTPPQRVAYHIEGITEQERDAIALDLAANTELHIAFACVPAGILVIEGSTTDQGRASTAVQQHVGSKTTTIDTRTQQDLETACENIRNR